LIQTFGEHGSGHRRLARHRPGAGPPVPEAGARVIATARDEAGADAGCGRWAPGAEGRCGPPASVSGLAWQLDGEAIDTAIYVAGVMSRASATEPPTQPEFDRVMHTNVLGAMQVIPQVAPLVAAAQQGRGGRLPSSPA
jgi:NAD(P)-dependent dehydrogenase (short-subunit alcohol dehydrogenase family)